MEIIIFAIVMLAVAGGIYAWLESRERKRAAAGEPRLGGIRLAFAAIAGLIILFAGGCGAIFFISMLIDGNQGGYIGPEVIAIFTLPPLAVGALIWWLATLRPKT